MASTTLGLRTRQSTVLGRLAGAARAVAPDASRWLRRAGRRVRSLSLQAGGLASISWAGFEVAMPLGLLVAGVSLLVFEWLSAPDEG